ncbi:MAG: nucleotidyltransferase substrate binding protein [Planctomycetaceae bacterium]|jgi:nucleotidyltransferase substrate binding protein (TIGR01987 family)|nr:nucleotidyltransferase substrate binding protein [Planctomycetaceae bacterium]
MLLDLTKLCKAIESLETAIRCSHSPYLVELDAGFPEVVRAAVIQNFEFTFELSWKLLERWLAEKLGSAAVKGISHKALFRLAGERMLVDDPARWFSYFEARNKTTHTYNALVAEEVYAKAVMFLEDAKQLFNHLNRSEEI